MLIGGIDVLLGHHPALSVCMYVCVCVCRCCLCGFLLFLTTTDSVSRRLMLIGIDELGWVVIPPACVSIC
jgi:hypothetical protein